MATCHKLSESATLGDVWDELDSVAGTIIVPLLVYPLIHAGPLHCLVNLLFLHLFGSRLESRASTLRFLLFVVSSGLIAGVAEVLLSPANEVVRVGASGTVAAMLGAYLCWYRSARAVFLVPLVVIPVFARLPVALAGGMWIVMQIAPVARFLGAGGAEPISWLAIAMGLLSGFILGPLLLFRHRNSR